MTWVPDTCTLPTAERPLRVAEFEELFTTGLIETARPHPRRLRLVLSAGPDHVRDLAERESRCCSFFTFTVTEDAGRVLLDIEVPEAHTGVLDALAAR